MPGNKRNSQKGQDLFASRLYDLMDQADRKTEGVQTSFLSLSERQIVEQICRDYHPVFWGGYRGAERVRARLFSDHAFIVSQSEDGDSDYDYSNWPDFDDPDMDWDSWTWNPAPLKKDQKDQDEEGKKGEENKRPDVTALRARLSDKGDPISHRDVLGALMHAGIEREVLGDFLCTDEEVWVFCTPSMADYVKSSLSRLRNQNLTFEEVTDPEDVPGMNRELIRINVSSLRADSIVAALAHCSRANAMTMIRQGLVKVNDVVLEDNKRLCNNDVVSVRRTGRFQFVREVNRTRKDRLVLEFLKYS